MNIFPQKRWQRASDTPGELWALMMGTIEAFLVCFRVTLSWEGRWEPPNLGRRIEEAKSVRGRSLKWAWRGPSARGFAIVAMVVGESVASRSKRWVRYCSCGLAVNATGFLLGKKFGVLRIGLEITHGGRLGVYGGSWLIQRWSTPSMLNLAHHTGKKPNYSLYRH